MLKKVLLAIVIAVGLVACLALAAHGQDAKVLALSSQDAAQAKALYAQQAALNKQIADFNEAMRHKYTQTSKLECETLYYLGSTASWTGSRTGKAKPVECPKELMYAAKDGWSYGFQYSDDFKYIVPVAFPKTDAGGISQPNGWRIAY